MGRIRDVVALLGGLLSLQALPALSQEADTEIEALMRLSIEELNEVVVTARRRPEPLQRVPMSVTQLDANLLRDGQVSGLGDLKGLVPNLVAHEGDASNAVLYLRGIGQLDSLFFSEPGVGVYLDDVYLGCPQCANLPLFDLERVEVLRGPQGTLYGKNTIAGAVKYMTRPVSGEKEATLEANLGNHNQRKLEGVIGGTLVPDVLLGRLSFSSDQRDGFAANTFNGRDDDDKRNLAWRGSLKWQPGRDWSAQLTVDGMRKTPASSRTPVRETPLWVAGSQRLYPRSSPGGAVDANYTSRNRTDGFGLTGTVNWEISPALSLRSVTAYRELDYAIAMDGDATRERVLDIWYQLRQRQFSQEFKLTYGSEKFNGVFGLYYYRDQNNAFDGVDMSDLVGAPLGTASIYGQKTRSHAVYGEGTYQWSERFSLTAGLRYTMEKKSFNRDYEVYVANDLPQPGSGISFHPGSVAAGSTGPFSMAKSWSSLSPKLGVQYQWHDDLMAYATVSSGFKSGGFDGRSHFVPGPFNQPYNPESLTSYELGAKSSSFNHRLVINASLFYNDYKNIQLSIIPPGSGGQPVLVNAGKGVSKGFELEFQAKPSLLGLTLRGALGYLDSRYSEFMEGGVNLAPVRQFAHAPSWTFLIGAAYQRPLRGHGTLKLGGDFRVLRHVYPTVSGSQLLFQKQIPLLNAYVSFETLDKRWLLTLSGKNLNQAAYRQHGFDFANSLGYQVAYYGDPRTYTLSLLHRF